VIVLVRGEVWRYKPVVQRKGRSELRLIVSADAMNNDRDMPTVYVARITAADTGSLISARIGDHGWAQLTLIERALKSRLVERLGVATSDELEAVGIALRAVFEL